MHSNLRFFIPASLLSVLSTGILFVLMLDYFDRQKKIRSEAKSQIKNVGNLISANIETAIRYNHNSIVRASIEQAQATRSVTYSLLMDRDDTIYSSNRRDLEGKILLSLPEKQLAIFIKQLGRRYALEYFTPDSPWLVYQLPLARQGSDIPAAKRADRLILVANIESQIKLAQMQTLRFVMLWALVTLLTAAMLWWILQRRVVAPVNSLRHLANHIAEHRENLPPPPKLMGEFSALDTAMRTMANKLWRMEKRYQDLYDKNPATFISVDDQLRIIDINVYGCEITGHSKKEITGRPIAHLYSKDDREKVEAYLYDILNDAQATAHWELKRVTKAGEIYWTRDGARRIEQDGQKQLLIVSQDITDLHNISQQLSYQAAHDELTNLLNRAEFSRLLEQAMQRSKTQRVQHCVCLLDLDQFKIVNDVCGHAAGDELLKQISQLFQQHVRRDDVLARLGGDEFGLLLECCESEKAMEVIDTLRETLAQNRFNWEDKFFDVGVSAGITIVDESTVSLQKAMSEADGACYTAKAMGRNRSILYQAEGKEARSMIGEMQWVNKIDKAFEDNDFTLYFQHIIALDNDADPEFKGEVLIRLEEDGKIIPPGAFLPAAERYNVAHKIDLWVVKRTLSLLEGYTQNLPKNWQVSINLSAQSISHPKFNKKIISLLEEYPKLCSNICFEITETTAMASYASAFKFIEHARSFGVSFSLDDFGSGFSSFGYLKKMNVDYVKIDGMFIRHLSNQAVDVALVESMNNIAHALNKSTIAEFIENDEIMTKLQELKVDYGQGYHLHKPEPFEAVLKRLNRPHLQLAPSA